jgi:type IX secretion system substrate protein
MKKTLFTVAMALGMTIAAKAQVLFASDFESVWTGTVVTGWFGTKTNITTSPDSAKKDSIAPYHGLYCVDLVNATTSTKRFSTQPLAVTAGTVYNVRFWAKGTGKIKPALYGVRGAGSPGYESSNYFTLAATPWTVYNQQLLADSTNSAAQFIFYAESTSSGNLQLDSVTISAVGTSTNVSLYQVQYTTATPANSPYMNQFVTTGGIITATYTSGYYIQTKNANAWAAVNVYDYNHTPAIGDSVTFSGQVIEFYNETEMQQIVNYTKVSSGNQALTPPTIVAFGGTNTIQSEQNEGLLVKVIDVTDVRYNASAAWYVFSDSTITLSVNSEDTIDNIIYTYGFTTGKKYDITGVVHFEYAMWIEPRNVNDIDSLGIYEAGIKNFQNNSSDVNIYPNPNNGVFTVSVNVLADEKTADIILTDITGRVIYKEQMDTHTGSASLPINTSSLEKGTYFIQISNSQSSTVKKVIIQ